MDIRGPGKTASTLALGADDGSFSPCLAGSRCLWENPQPRPISSRKTNRFSPVAPCSRGLVRRLPPFRDHHEPHRFARLEQSVFMRQQHWRSSTPDRHLQVFCLTSSPLVNQPLPARMPGYSTSRRSNGHDPQHVLTGCQKSVSSTRLSALSPF